LPSVKKKTLGKKRHSANKQGCLPSAWGMTLGKEVFAECEGWALGKQLIHEFFNKV